MGNVRDNENARALRWIAVRVPVGRKMALLWTEWQLRPEHFEVLRRSDAGTRDEGGEG